MKKNKPTHQITLKPFEFAWYIDKDEPQNGYMEITVGEGLMSFRINCHFDAFYLMLAAYEQRDENLLRNFAFLITSSISYMATDVNFFSSLLRLVSDTTASKMNAAEDSAKDVSENEESAAQAFMEDVVKYADADDNEKKRLSEEFKTEVKNVLS